MKTARFGTRLGCVGAFGAALIAASPAHATYTGLTAAKYTTVNVGGGLKDVWRVYADFTTDHEYITAIVGSPTYGTMVIETRNADDTGPGGNFFNPGGAGGNTAPSTPDGEIEWGTFGTIGVSLTSQGTGDPYGNPDATWTTPGFPTFINGNQLSNGNLGWFTAGPVEQGRSGYAGDGDLLNRVLVMQLTVDAGDQIRSTVAVFGWQESSTAALSEFNHLHETFTTVPGAGAIAALGCAGLMGSRRRRTRN